MHINRHIAMLAAVGAFAVAVPQSHADPTLTLADNDGHSTTVTDPTGFILFNGSVGKWAANVSTGIVSPPSSLLGGNPSYPVLDLNSVNVFNGSPNSGNVLTITLTGDNLGPIFDSLFNSVGGTEAGITDTFEVLVNGTSVLSRPFSAAGSFSADDYAPGGIPAGSTLSIRATLTANSEFGLTSFDDHLHVPDTGATASLLGLGLLSTAVVNRRTRK